jgi:hypothetical protein
VVAEATPRELERLTLEEALRLLLLYAEQEPIKFERAALRWLVHRGESRLSAEVAGLGSEDE